MGYARILNHLGEARYNVELDYGEERKQQRLSKLTNFIQQAEQQVLEREAELEAQAQRVAEIADTLNQATAAYVAALQAGEDGQALRAAVDEGSAILLEASLIKTKLENGLDLAKAQKLTLEKQKAEVTGIATLETRALWCGDYTTDLSGLVATCELVGEQGEIVVYPPARREGGGNTQIDGFLLARGLMSPEQAFFNAAILPGWQKHRPKHRAGTITAINTSNDTASVTLDAIQSSAQSLDIRPEPSTLNDVPIRYMDCDSLAFEVGDRVVVEYVNGTPTVIGFVTEPRECAASGFLVTSPTGVMLIYRDDDNQWADAALEMFVAGDGWWHGQEERETLRWSATHIYRKRTRIGSAAGSYPGSIVSAAIYEDTAYIIKAHRATGSSVTVTYLEIAIESNIIQFVQQSFYQALNGFPLLINDALPYFQFPSDMAHGDLTINYSTRTPQSHRVLIDDPYSWCTREIRWTRGVGLTVETEEVSSRVSTGVSTRHLFNAEGVAVVANISADINRTKYSGSASFSVSIPYFSISDLQLYGVTYQDSVDETTKTFSQNNLRKMFLLYVDPSNPDVAFLHLQTYTPISVGGDVDALTITHGDVPTVGITAIDIEKHYYDRHRYNNYFLLRKDNAPQEFVDLRSVFVNIGTWDPNRGESQSQSINIAMPMGGSAEAWGVCYLAPIMIRIPRSFAGDTCASFTFPRVQDSDPVGPTINYITEGDLTTIVGASQNYRPLSVV